MAIHRGTPGIPSVELKAIEGANAADRRAVLVVTGIVEGVPLEVRCPWKHRKEVCDALLHAAFAAYRKRAEPLFVFDEVAGGGQWFGAATAGLDALTAICRQVAPPKTAAAEPPPEPPPVPPEDAPRKIKFREWL